MLKAITRRATSVDTKVRSINVKRAASSPPQAPITVAYFFDHLAAPEDTEVVVGQEDFELAVRELVPSVSVKELEHYNVVRSSFEKGEEKKEGLAHGLKTRMPPVLHGEGTGARWREEEDDFVRRTEGLSLVGEDEHQMNGTAHGLTNGAHGMGKGKGKGGGEAKGKGKGKQVANGHDEFAVGFGDAGDGDEDLYAA